MTSEKTHELSSKNPRVEHGVSTLDKINGSMFLACYSLSLQIFCPDHLTVRPCQAIALRLFDGLSQQTEPQKQTMKPLVMDFLSNVSRHLGLCWIVGSANLLAILGEFQHIQQLEYPSLRVFVLSYLLSNRRRS